MRKYKTAVEFSTAVFCFSIDLLPFFSDGLLVSGEIMRFLWFFVSLSLLCCAGCSGVVESKPQPRNTPVIGEIILASQQNNPNCAVIVPVSNIRLEKLEAKIYIRGSKQDILHPISGFTAKIGSSPGVTLFEITKKRSATIYGKIEWNIAEERGVKRFSITPEQTNEIKIK